MSIKPKEKYLVIFAEDDFYETYAVSEKQAVNNVKHQLGLAGSYQYHDYEPIRVEKIELKINLEEMGK